ncbi:MAG: catalase [Sediminibacterium sp.]|nr:catalase [Sediminibacterium sp.]
MKATSLTLTGLLFSLQITFAQKPLTTNNGAPVGDNQNSLTIGNEGPVLLEDIHLVEKLAAFDRERIPERVVHARGAGVHGVFECKADMSAFTKAALFNRAGKQTPVFVRFSTVVHGQGSPETLRDPRGFATKFYTEEGNYDIVGNNLPVFFIRDAIKFPDMVHSLKPSPITNKQDPNRFFDFFSHIPEATHMLTRVYSDYGIPASYREMNGSSVHAFKWINAKNEVVYVKYTWKSLQGERNLSVEEAAKIQGSDFQHATVDLYNTIKKGNFPKWDLYVQMLKASDFEKLDYYPLDATKIWNEKDAPLTLVGTMTLNKIPDNFFEYTEQSAFSPASLVPGIEPSEDKLLQGRLFSYFDTHRYRIGANFQQLPVNAPLTKTNSNNQDGSFSNKGTRSNVNYQPSRTEDKPEREKEKHSAARYGDVSLAQTKITKQNNFQQAGEFYRSLDETNKSNLVKNLSGDLGAVESKEVKSIMVGYFYMADRDLGIRLSKALSISREDVEKYMMPKK